MLRVCWSLSGEEGAVSALEEMSTQPLHERYGAPVTRFHQSLSGCELEVTEDD